MIIQEVELFLEKYNLLRPKNNIITAFSGGYDSMCLLDIMKKLALKYDFNIIAIHLNHNWRGLESDNEEEICKNYCSDITFYSEKLSSKIPHTETAARNARYEFFEKCAKKFHSDIVLTAHNANDNAETIFYRILKGTGITGLEGIQENRGIFYRPLLNVYRSDIEEYCKKNNLHPNNDSSNQDTSFIRNKIRHDIFPELKQLAPNFEKNLNKISKNAEFINKYIDNEIKYIEEYSTEEFCNFDKDYQMTIIHKFLREQNIDYDRKRIEYITQFISKNSASKSGKTASLTKDKWLFVNNKKIKILNEIPNKPPTQHITQEGKYRFGEYVFEIEKAAFDILKEFPQDNEYTAYVELEEINYDIRCRNDGDIIQPLGLNGTQKLKKYLNEKKIPQHEKDCIVFLCKDKEILWAAGLGISEKIKVVTQPTHVLRLRRGK